MRRCLTAGCNKIARGETSCEGRQIFSISTVSISTRRGETKNESLGANCYFWAVEEGETVESEIKEKRDTSGHEGERQIKFDRKLHEIVGEPRWPELRCLQDYSVLPTTTIGPRQEVQAGPVYRGSHDVPDADNAPNVRSVTQRWARRCTPRFGLS